jgi:hypothetical protein
MYLILQPMPNIEQFLCQKLQKKQASLLSVDINTFAIDHKKIPPGRCKKCLQNGATIVAGATNVAGIYISIFQQNIKKMATKAPGHQE